MREGRSEGGSGVAGLIQVLPVPMQYQLLEREDSYILKQ